MYNFSVSAVGQKLYTTFYLFSCHIILFGLFIQTSVQREEFFTFSDNILWDIPGTNHLLLLFLHSLFNLALDLHFYFRNKCIGGKGGRSISLFFSVCMVPGFTEGTLVNKKIPVCINISTIKKIMFTGTRYNALRRVVKVSNIYQIKLIYVVQLLLLWCFVI